MFLPALRRASSGTTWADGPYRRHSRDPISDFFVAHPDDSAQVINNALARGQDLLFTPGIYAWTAPSR